ncbi:MAG: Beta-ketoacyl synthase [Phycisphaerales bacterium]|nr:Beta-ketoacyl synthase [Phycisphaerales bacterium]
MTSQSLAATSTVASNPYAASATWVDLLRQRAVTEPALPAFTFLNDGETETGKLTNGELDAQARAIGAKLQARTQPGDRVILAHPPGLDFIAAFFGCLYAGVIAVPTFPPRTNGNGHRMTARARGVVAHAKPTVILTIASDTDRVAAALECDVPVVGTDTIAIETAAAWRAPTIDPQTLCCLQYTSGTSGTPKGVMLTHAALLANCRQIQDRFATSRDTRAVLWLPPYHDMGLVGAILHSLFVGFDIVLMPPSAFLQKPLRWMAAISKYRATHAGGPCFSFGLCAQQISDADAAKLDLSCLNVTFTGAETVRPDVLGKFTNKFAASGFDPRSYLACYGMAETTLLVSGVRPGAGLNVGTPLTSSPGTPLAPSPGNPGEGLRKTGTTAASADPLPSPPPDYRERGQDAGGRSASHVSCGTVAIETELFIVDPATRQVRSHGTVGEIWTRSPSVAAGYWQNPEATAAAFAGHLSDGSKDIAGPFVRTGDLGFVRDGEVFVTGRLKELIIIRGVNHMPHEVERTAEEAHAAVQPQGVAAFSIDGPDGERLALAIELQRAQRNTNPEELIAAVRAAVAEVHGLEAHHVVLLKPGGLPRTPSGKVQRSACRDGLADGSLEPMHASVLATPSADAPEVASIAPDHPASAQAEDISAWLVAVLASALNASPDQIDPTQPVGGYGLGSADGVGFAGTISTRLGIDLPATTLWDYPTLAELAVYIAEILAGGDLASAEAA